MKRFNPERELYRIQNYKTTKKNNVLTPLLIICFSLVALVGISFSYRQEKKEEYTIKVNILNGPYSSFSKKVGEGPFEEVILSSTKLGSLNCTEGFLKYDEENKKIYSDNITENTTCILSFVNEGKNEAIEDNMIVTQDDYGYSYFYKWNANNNYFRINDIMFRIIRINGDGTYRLITDEIQFNSYYGQDSIYETSTTKREIEIWFNNFFKENNHISYEMFDTSSYEDPNSFNDLKNLENSELNNVGLLSAREYYFIHEDGKKDFLSLDDPFLTSNRKKKEVWAVRNNTISPYDSSYNFGVRPVINIHFNKLNGNGTYKNPYTIED